MRVLVIEDEPRIVAVVHGALEAAGIAVAAARSRLTEETP
jgi:DNA-binding response OmpR family regulator